MPVAADPKIRRAAVEALEPRMLMAESASAALVLASTTGTQANPVYHYNATVTDTGTTNIGTFWLGWIPGEDFLPSLPSAVSNPTGWTNTLTGSNNSTDGTAIEWVASSNHITPGNSLSGFSFTTTDSPAALAANSPSHPGSPTLTTFVYSGAPFSDAGFQFVVSQAATTNASTTTLTSSALTRAFGDAVTFTATVASSSGSGATPTGTVAFSQDGVALGSSVIQPDGTASLTRSNLPVGTDHITATYGGDANYTGSASASFTQTISPPTNAVVTTTTLASSAPSAASGTAVVLTATITPATLGAAPTGTVSFAQGATVLGTAPVQSDGTAALTTSTLPVGTDSIIATYTGDNAHATSASAPFTQTITAPLTLAPTITKSTLPTAIVSGAAAHGAVTVNITNQSAATIKGKTTVAIFASTTGAIDGSSINLGETSKTLSVTTAKPVSASVNLKIAAAALPAGHYTLFARVTDANGNVSDSPAGPTLDVAAPFIALTEALAGSSLPTTAIANSKSHGSAILTITNSGNITTAGITTLALFATANGTIDGTALQLNTLTQPLKIKPGKSARASIPIKQIPAIPPGNYTIVARITDPNGAISSVLVGSLTITA